MVTENSWLYLLTNEVTVEIQCIDFKTVLKLSDRGTLTLKPNCQAKIGNAQLMTTNTMIRKISLEQVDLIPKIGNNLETHEIQLAPIESPTNSLKLLDHKKQSLSLIDHKNKLEDVLNKITQIQKERELRSQTKMQTTHTISLTTMGALLIIAVIIMLILIRRIKQHPGNFQHHVRFSRKRRQETIKPKTPYVETTNATEVREVEELPASPQKPKSENVTQVKLPSLPVTTPTVPIILQNRNSKLNVSDFEIV